METAEKLFAEKGFSGTSVRDIADAADVNVAMISYYFGSKEKLFEALFSYRAESSTLKLESVIQDKQLTALEKVYSLVDYYIDRIQRYPCFNKIFLREQMTNFRSTTTAMITDYKKKNQELIKQIINEGQKKGEIKKGVDVPMMMATLIGTASHLVTTQHYFKELNNLESLSEEEFNKYLKKKLSIHLKTLFKALLTNEV
ncbi:TetR family transcriptional regulator [Ferruginibacter albus]|uniref:TetR family transcriptional regulator n=1 Tax=Ferruginibacter albus TaxID=2875540 RepID=UPI001CC350D2|nr:TetR family transcriptional regulator [Ferruginibacter albus]UAY52097.1 TetR family transcriptional regulator [Ferruginibacter albus]